MARAFARDVAVALGAADYRLPIPRPAGVLVSRWLHQTVVTIARRRPRRRPSRRVPVRERQTLIDAVAVTRPAARKNQEGLARRDALR